MIITGSSAASNKRRSPDEERGSGLVEGRQAAAARAWRAERGKQEGDGVAATVAALSRHRPALGRRGPASRSVVRQGGTLGDRKAMWGMRDASIGEGMMD